MGIDMVYHDVEKINKIHKAVPPDFYDHGMKNNLFQRYWHNKRLNLIGEMLKGFKGDILDLGCHGGMITGAISRFAKTSNVYGLDISENAIRYARKKYPHIKFKVYDLNKNIPCLDKVFDLITCFDVLEHIINPTALVEEIKRVLKKDGSVIVEIPNETLLFKFIWLVWTNLKGRVWKNTHVNHFAVKDLENLFERNGFVKTGEKKIHFQMLWVIKYKLSD